MDIAGGIPQRHITPLVGSDQFHDALCGRIHDHQVPVIAFGIHGRGCDQQRRILIADQARHCIQARTDVGQIKAGDLLISRHQQAPVIPFAELDRLLVFGEVSMNDDGTSNTVYPTYRELADTLVP